MSKKIVLRGGLDLPVTGLAEKRIAKTVNPATVAVCPDNFPGFTPRLLVREGDAVKCGSPVLADKKRPEVIVVSPVSGTVKEIVRGEKRKLLAVVVEQDGKREALDFGAKNPAELDAPAIKKAILESGLWPFIIQRPYGIIANPADEPKAIFVSAFDTAPLAADAAFTLATVFPTSRKASMRWPESPKFMSAFPPKTPNRSTSSRTPRSTCSKASIPPATWVCRSATSAQLPRAA